MKKIHPKKFVFNYQKKDVQQKHENFSSHWILHTSPSSAGYTTCLSFKKKEFVYFSPPYPTYYNYYYYYWVLSTQNKKAILKKITWKKFCEPFIIFLQYVVLAWHQKSKSKERPRKIFGNRENSRGTFYEYNTFRCFKLV